MAHQGTSKRFTLGQPPDNVRRELMGVSVEQTAAPARSVTHIVPSAGIWAMWCGLMVLIAVIVGFMIWFVVYANANAPVPPAPIPPIGPAVHTPPAAIPPGTIPPGAIPPGAIPPGAIPSAPPAVHTPPGAIPPVPHVPTPTPTAPGEGAHLRACPGVCDDFHLAVPPNNPHDCAALASLAALPNPVGVACYRHQCVHVLIGTDFLFGALQLGADAHYRDVEGDAHCHALLRAGAGGDTDGLVARHAPHDFFGSCLYHHACAPIDVRTDTEIESIAVVFTAHSGDEGMPLAKYVSGLPPGRYHTAPELYGFTSHPRYDDGGTRSLLEHVGDTLLWERAEGILGRFANLSDVPPGARPPRNPRRGDADGFVG